MRKDSPSRTLMDVKFLFRRGATCVCIYKRVAKHLLLFLICAILYLLYKNYFGTRIHLNFIRKPCRLPQLDPFDKSVALWNGIPDYVPCANYSSLLYVDDGGYLQLNQSALSEYNLGNLTCTYYIVHRIDGDRTLNVDEESDPFTPPYFVPARVFRVTCNTNELRKVYDFVHVNMAWNESNIKEDTIGYETDYKLSVIYIGLDSMPRSKTIRNLPRTFKYLTETLGAYDFRGYTKRGFNTYPNMYTALTGEYPEDHYFVNMMKIFYLDTVPFIWNDPMMKDYVTFFYEDRADIATFHDPRPRFKKSPTDYYSRPYLLAMEKFEPTIVKPLGESDMYCFGNKDHTSLQIDQFKRFMTKYTDRLKFVYLWRNSVSHNIHNYEYWDDIPLMNLLKWLKENGHLDRAVLIFGSDHGDRTSNSGSTNTGRLENNMPVLAMYVPEILKQNYPTLQYNLEKNTNKLLSAFDVYKTMKSVINMQYHENEIPDSKVGHSLFSNISDMRTCDEAGIPPEYCTCDEQIPIKTTDSRVVKLALYTVAHLNKLLQKYRNLCRELKLHNVTYASVVYTPSTEHMDSNKVDTMQTVIGQSGKYIIVFFTKPNYGLLEAMVDFKINPSSHLERISVIGVPTRVNRYGNQSHCIKEPSLKQYCLCYDIKIPR